MKTKTAYVTKEQATAAAAAKGYTLEFDAEKFEVRILANSSIVATVWLTSDVVKWCKSAPIAVAPEVVAPEPVAPAPSLKQQVAGFVATVKENLNPRFYTTTNLDSFALTLDIFYIPERKVIGRVTASRMSESASYHLPTDARSVSRNASSVANAVEVVTENHLSSLRSCFVA